MFKRSRKGFTVIEMVVVVAVLLILAAAFVPSMIGSLERSRVTAAVDALQDITDAMTLMRRDNQDWPGRLSHLSQPIVAGDKNVCQNNYSAGKINNWAGPYLDRLVPPTGLNIGIGVLQDEVYRSAQSGQDALLTLEAPAVSHEDVLALNAAVDNDGDVAGRTTGVVQWTVADSEGLVTLFYYRPIRGC